MGDKAMMTPQEIARKIEEQGYEYDFVSFNVRVPMDAVQKRYPNASTAPSAILIVHKSDGSELVHLKLKNVFSTLNRVLEQGPPQNPVGTLTP